MSDLDRLAEDTVRRHGLGVGERVACWRPPRLVVVAH